MDTRLVEENMELARQIVYRARLPPTPVVDYDDMLGAGYLSLVEASGEYTPTKGMSPKNFLGRRIRWGLLNAYRAQFIVPSYAMKRHAWEPYQVNGTDFYQDDGDGALEARLPGDTDRAWADEVAVRVAMESLPELQRTVVRLYFFKEKSLYEIADHLGMPRTTVNYNLRAALERMRAYLTELPS